MKKVYAIVIFMLCCFASMGCDKVGEVTNYYENNEYTFKQISMPDGRRVWVDTPKKSVTAVSTSQEYMSGKVKRYDTVVVVSDDGNEKVLSRKEIK